MAKFSCVKGTTSRIVHIFIQDTSSTTGGGLSGLVYNSASLTAYYIRPGDSAATSITLATATLGTYASGGFKEVSSTNMKGLYELHIPNACLASGAPSVTILLRGTTNMAPVALEIELTGVDNQDAVRGGMTALPNATAGASTGLIINGTNTGAVTFTGHMIISDGLEINASTTNRDALVATGSGSGHGLRGIGGTTGNGIRGEAAGASGVAFLGTAGNNNGFICSGNGSGFGGRFVGGSTGAGMNLAGGGTSGNGLTVSTTSGDGIAVSASGASKHGIVITGGNSGTSDALKLVAGSGGVQFRGDITGNLSGSVGTLTSTVTLAADQSAVASFMGANAIETGISVIQGIRYCLATLAGVATGGGTSTITFKDPSGSSTRVVLTADTDGNRSASTLS